MVRDEWRCRSCGARCRLAAHHIVFRSQQGDDALYNMLTLCTYCHDQIHSHILEILPLVEGERIDANKGVRWRTYF